MRCPYFVATSLTGTSTRCYGVVVPFEPSSAERAQYCVTGRHRLCPLYRNAANDLSLTIHREVTRAVG
jgi:hypothetical protein